MKEEVATREDDPISLSYDKIFKELSKFEKDYRHQETQLKIKTEELTNVTATNQILKEHLESAFSEIENLRTQIQVLEVKSNEIETASNQEKEFCDQIVQKLTAKITNMSSEFRSSNEKCTALLEQTKKEMLQEHERFVNELQKRHGEDLVQLEQQIQLETNHSRQLQTKLDFTLEDNLLLQDKLRKVHQEYLPMDAYKSQLKTLTTANDKLKSQYLHAKNNCQALSTENSHLQKHNERLTAFVDTYNQEEKQHEQFSEEQEMLLARTQKQLNDSIVKSKSLLDECNNFKVENNKLMQEVGKYKKDHCNIETHYNILEQNRVLQELVKEMRKERLNCNGDQRHTDLDLVDTEERVKRLEELIQELKKVLIGNYLNRVHYVD